MALHNKIKKRLKTGRIPEEFMGLGNGSNIWFIVKNGSKEGRYIKHTVGGKTEDFRTIYEGPDNFVVKLFCDKKNFGAVVVEERGGLQEKIDTLGLPKTGDLKWCGGNFATYSPIIGKKQANPIYTPEEATMLSKYGQLPKSGKFV
jgi:hypothetical protein